MSRVRCGLGLWLACLVLALPAEAGIYKCTGADGKVRYTSDASHCENAEPHVLKKRVQQVIDDGASRRRTSRPAAPRGGAGGDGLEAMWKGKRPQAERELAETRQRLERMQGVIRGCNRGGEWYKTDKSGIRQHVSCSELREKQAELQKKHDDLVHYLAEGLEDECRRAGCQPGWVR